MEQGDDSKMENSGHKTEILKQSKTLEKLKFEVGQEMGLKCKK